MKYPRLFVNDKFKQIVNPVSVSITQNIMPLSTAVITLPKGENLPSRSYVELFTPYGSAGMFRVRSPRDAYGQEVTAAELEHMISEVGDYLVKEEVSEMKAADAAMKQAFKYYKGGRWQLGSVSALGTGKIAYEVDYDRVLDVMLSILQQKHDCMMAFDFSTKPWTVSIVKKVGTVSAEGRLSRNVTSAIVTNDDTELVTRAWYQVFDKKKKPTWKSKDSNVSKYGLVEMPVRTSSDMTDAEITKTVDAFLADHSKPRVSINIQAVELCQITGESLDKLEVGKLYRLALPDDGTSFEDYITSIEWSDVYNDSTSVTVTLGDEEDTVPTFLHNLDAKGAGGGGGGGAKDDLEKLKKEYYTIFDKQDEYIGLLSVHQDEQGNILEQAGLTLNPDGLLVYAETSNGLKHQFDVLNNSFTSSIKNLKKNTETLIEQLEDQINLKVDIDGVISAINLEKGTATIDADKINIKGIISGLKSENLDVGDINCEGSITVDQDVSAGGTVSGLAGSFDDLIVGEYAASWKSASYKTFVLSATHDFVYGNSYVTGQIITGSIDHTIYFLGR